MDEETLRKVERYKAELEATLLRNMERAKAKGAARAQAE